MYLVLGLEIRRTMFVPVHCHSTLWSSESSSVSLKVNTTVVVKSGDWVTLSWDGVPNPSDQDWIGVYLTAGDGKINTTNHAPVKYQVGLLTNWPSAALAARPVHVRLHTHTPIIRISSHVSDYQGTHARCWQLEIKTAALQAHSLVHVSLCDPQTFSCSCITWGLHSLSYYGSHIESVIKCCRYISGCIPNFTSVILILNDVDQDTTSVVAMLWFL